MIDDHDQEGGMPIPFQRPSVDDTLGSLQYQLDNTDVIQEIEYTLRNAVPYIGKDGRVEWRNTPDRPSLINDNGINNVLSVVKSRLNKIMILSDLDQQTINNMVNDIHEDLIDDFLFNWKKYGIKDTASASMVVSMVTDTVYATLRKGYLGNYMKLLRSMHTIQEIQQGRAGGQRAPQAQSQSIGERIQDMLLRRRR